MSWSIHSTIPTLAVPDLDAGITFYERLGFTLDWRWPEKDGTHAGMQRGTCAIMLARSTPDERADLYFIVDDIQGCYDAICRAEPWTLADRFGAMADREDCPPTESRTPPEAPDSTAYGLIDFSLIDPWGHHLTFGAPQDDAREAAT